MKQRKTLLAGARNKEVDINKVLNRDTTALQSMYWKEKGIIDSKKEELESMLEDPKYVIDSIYFTLTEEIKRKENRMKEIKKLIDINESK